MEVVTIVIVFDGVTGEHAEEGVKGHNDVNDGQEACDVKKYPGN